MRSFVPSVRRRTRTDCVPSSHPRVEPLGQELLHLRQEGVVHDAVRGEHDVHASVIAHVEWEQGVDEPQHAGAGVGAVHLQAFEAAPIPVEGEDLQVEELPLGAGEDHLLEPVARQVGDHDAPDVGLPEVPGAHLAELRISRNVHRQVLEDRDPGREVRAQDDVGSSSPSTSPTSA
jgi:hypothetical protein